MKNVNLVWISSGVLKKYYIQLILFSVIISNQISNLWKDDKSKHVSFSGEIGFSNWFHYWLVFDHYIQYMIYLILIVLVLIFPLKGEFKNYAVASVLLYFSINAVEISYYLHQGNNNHNFNMFGCYLLVYGVGHAIFLFRNKVNLFKIDNFL